MKVSDEPSQIKDKRVAFLNEKKGRRKLAQSIDWVETEKPLPEALLTTESLELRVRPGDSEINNNLNYTWYVIEHTERYIWIQIMFEDPTQVSTDINQLDKLEVYFWGVDYGFFERADTGREVRFGTKLEIPIVRQISPEGDASIARYATIVRVLLWMLLLLVALGTGRLLPIWMFINSL